MKINFIRKISSRKFWAALAAFVASILVVFNVPDITIEQTVTVICGLGTILVYIFGESVVDAMGVSCEDESLQDDKKVNFIKKITSRKFLAALTGFVTSILVAFNVPDITIEQVVAFIGATVTLIAYILGESAIDATGISGGVELVPEVVNDNQEGNNISCAGALEGENNEQ